jgi:hypothetical protein
MWDGVDVEEDVDCPNIVLEAPEEDIEVLVALPVVVCGNGGEWYDGEPVNVAPGSSIIVWNLPSEIENDPPEFEQLHFPSSKSFKQQK